ncbi:hypothetical protein ACFVFH_21705 [Streptomyces sp. NPDC057697]|uniref:hypothetical protein n=1 Tax=Streptomyces sp. NPDC057697 TaxID=3346219 RepID=UPI00369219B2
MSQAATDGYGIRVGVERVAAYVIGVLLGELDECVAGGLPNLALKDVEVHETR